MDMTMYFYVQNNQKYGPLTLEELVKQNLTNDILVWKDGLTDWIRASELDELKDFIVKEPPPLPSEKKEFKIKTPDLKIDKSSSHDFIPLVITLIISIILYFGRDVISNSLRTDEALILPSIFVWVLAIYFTSRQAERKFRSIGGWCTFSIFCPGLALIIISFLKGKLYPRNFEHYSKIDKSNINLEIAEDYSDKGIIDEAIYFANLSYEQNPQNLEALFKRGELYFYLKQTDLAIRDLELYCKTNPNKKVLQLLLKIYEKKGDTNKSRYYKDLTKVP